MTIMIVIAMTQIPTREKVTGMKCMFLPPSRVSSGLVT